MGPGITSLLDSRNYEGAFELLLAGYQHKVFRLVISMIRDHGRAEEVTQDAFLKIWEALPAYDGRAAIGTWVYTIARNTCLTRLRAESYRRTTPIEDAPERGVSDRPEERLDAADLLAQLPEDQRRVVELFYMEGRAVQEVAAMLDLPDGTVKSMLYRARRAMAAMMEVKR